MIQTCWRHRQRGYIAYLTTKRDRGKRIAHSCAIHPQYAIDDIHRSRIQRERYRCAELTGIGCRCKARGIHRNACCISTKRVRENIIRTDIYHREYHCLCGCSSAREVCSETHDCRAWCSRSAIQPDPCKWYSRGVHTACGADDQVTCAITHIACNKAHRNRCAKLCTAGGCCKTEIPIQQEITCVCAGG